MYQIIYKNLKSLSEEIGVPFRPKDDNNDNKKRYVTNALKDQGFTEILLMKSKHDPKYRYPQKYLQIQLNPTKLLDRDIIELTKEEDIAEVQRRFNRIVEEKIHLGLNPFMRWTLKRIDYAKNITTPHVKEYIKLFQRADKPHSFVIPYNNESKDRTYKKGSFYLKSKSVRINFYDKANERLNNSHEEVESAKNILRLEVQLLKSKTDAMRYKYKFNIKHLGYFLSEEISTRELSYYYNKTIGKGRYYKLDKAIKKVNESDHTQGMKEKLIQVLKEVNAARSIWKARDKERYSRESFRTYLKLIREEGINPVTIPRDWGIDELEGINIDIDTDIEF